MSQINSLQSSAQQKITDALMLLNRESKRTTEEMRKLIVGLETVIQAMPGNLTAKDFNTKHHFSPGIYMRELSIPKGTVLTGKIHKTAHLNILSQGKLTVWTEDGMKTLSASTVILSQPGIKRVGFAHEDSVWITVHHNSDGEMDVEKLESKLTVETFEEFYLSTGSQPLLEGG